MLAVIALQGTGLLHALHLAGEHSPSHCSGCASGHSCENGHGEESLALSSLHEQEHPHNGHVSRGICPVCQTLAALKAATDGNPDVTCFGLLPGGPAASGESFPLPRIALFTLGPRAPPAST